MAARSDEMEAVAMAQQVDAALEDVQVGGEVEHVADDPVPLRPQGQGGHDPLE
jgi:hypothetical protein